MFILNEQIVFILWSQFKISIFKKIDDVNIDVTSCIMLNILILNCLKFWEHAESLCRIWGPMRVKQWTRNISGGKYGISVIGD
jgi:hypothetical protein